MKNSLCDYVQKHALELYGMADEIFDHPEIGFQEFFASGLLCDWLEDKGYRVERGICGCETAFRAIYQQGEGGPSIGLLAEYDALPMGHACGHHLQGPIMLLAAQALRNAGNIETPYQLVIYGTPAEEGFRGKGKMIENDPSAFQDIDVALMTHASPYTTTDVKSLAGSSWDAEFTGVPAHESLTPELVRSATDAVVIAFQGLEFLRGHVKEDVKLNTKIVECSGTPGAKNGIAKARMSVTIRTYHAPDVQGIERRVCDIFEGAAKMMGCTVSYQKSSNTLGKIPSYSLNRIIMQNAAEMEMPNQLPYRSRTGSTDFADVTHLVAGAVSRFVLVEDIRATSHSQEFLDAGKGKPAQQGIIMGAELISTTVYDLLTQPGLLAEVKAEFLKNSQDFKEEIM